MKRVLSFVVLIMCAAGLAFAAEESGTDTSTAKSATASKAPVTKAAVEVTKEAADTVTSGMERRQDRREARRGALLGLGQNKEASTNAK